MPAIQNTLDVSHLPDHSFGPHAPLWWGNTLLLFIETTMFALLAATYFYLHMNFTQWPPVNSNHFPPLYDTRPDLWASTSITIILLLACIPMALVHIGALRMNAFQVRIGLIVVIAAGIAATVLRFFEFSTLHFNWDDNAYGSITWTILGMHLLHLITVTAETAVIASYVLTHPMKPKQALDVTLTAIYFYWVAAIWLIFYVIVYWSPRWT